MGKTQIKETYKGQHPTPLLKESRFRVETHDNYQVLSANKVNFLGNV